MKKILSFLIKFKWTLIFPFASLFIWGLGFMSASFERFLPYCLERTTYYWRNSGMSNNYDISRLTGTIGWFVNGINAWIPIYMIVTFVFILIAWRFLFFGIRAFIKLITVGQV